MLSYTYKQYNYKSRVQYIIVITQDEYDIIVITRVRGETEDKC